MRLRLGALGRAFSKRSEETRVSHEVHQIALATLSLTDALATVHLLTIVTHMFILLGFCRPKPWTQGMEPYECTLNLHHIFGPLD